jgi:hypothetical protein
MIEKTGLRCRLLRRGISPPPCDTATGGTFSNQINRLSVVRHICDTCDTCAFCSPFLPLTVASVDVLSHIRLRHLIYSFSIIYYENERMCRNVFSTHKALNSLLQPNVSQVFRGVYISWRLRDARRFGARIEPKRAPGRKRPASGQNPLPWTQKRPAWKIRKPEKRARRRFKALGDTITPGKWRSQALDGSPTRRYGQE